MIRPIDIDELLDALAAVELSEWCVVSDIGEAALRRVVAALGSGDDTETSALSAFRLGYEARKRSESSLSGSGLRYSIQHVVVDSESDTIVHGPSQGIDFLMDLTMLFNDGVDQHRSDGSSA